MGDSVVNSQAVDVAAPDSTQKDIVDIYVKVFFTIQRSSSPRIHETMTHLTADHLHLRDIKGSTSRAYDVHGKISTSFVIDCSQLFVNEDEGTVDDPGGQDDKIEEAAQLVTDYLDDLSGTIENANVHMAVVGFEIIEDTVRGFSYLFDQSNGLSLHDALLAELVQQSSLMSEEFSEWKFITEYIGVFEHHVLFQPITPQSAPVCSSPAVSSPATDGIRQEPEHDTPRFELSVEENVYVDEPSDSDEDESTWLDTTQMVGEGVGLAPVVGEVVNLANGLVYLGREIHAAATGDFDKMYEMRDNAVMSFVGAIPFSSVAKGGARIYKAGKGLAKVEESTAKAAKTTKIAEKSEQAAQKSEQLAEKSAQAAEKSEQAAKAATESAKAMAQPVKAASEAVETSSTTAKNARRTYKNIKNKGKKGKRRKSKAKKRLDEASDKLNEDTTQLNTLQEAQKKKAAEARATEAQASADRAQASADRAQAITDRAKANADKAIADQDKLTAAIDNAKLFDRMNRAGLWIGDVNLLSKGFLNKYKATMKAASHEVKDGFKPRLTRSAAKDELKELDDKVITGFFTVKVLWDSYKYGLKVRSRLEEDKSGKK
ncbi:MAG: hypothetical protein IJ613_08380 [Muribaculaceae bacterium]|nr:hypothetical protein [Muribaculaceae bacterium]MBR1475571.1 hypothetical protein [Muribaculaceae bacterium]